MDSEDNRQELIIGEVADVVDYAINMLVKRIATRVEVLTDGGVRLIVQAEGGRITCIIDNLL